ncbi:hypothetical protein E3W21_17575 [Pseudomonas sp. F01002]|nr:hypothetical protein FQ187_27505 [Pseudomonas sp. ANT_J28]TFB39295.1 hypothetical protein E3W21_17575 [Pseudomonas sp. F01002]
MRCSHSILECGEQQGEHKILLHQKSTVGAGLLANAVDQSTLMLNDTPHSRASPLPHWFFGVWRIRGRHLKKPGRSRVFR